MIVKIVHYGAIGDRGVGIPGGDEVIPEQVVLYDGIDEVTHERVAFTDIEELATLSREFGVSSGDSAWCGPETVEGELTEAVLMRLRCGTSYMSIVAVDSKVFFMNESGKTIDQVICR